MVENSNSNLSVQLVGLESGGSCLTNKSRSITISEQKTLNYLYVFLSSSDNDNATATFTKIQLEKNTKATDYEPHQEQTVYFPLAEGQKLYEGSYLADDGIHHIREQIVLDGTETYTFYPNKTSTFMLGLGKLSASGICSHYSSIAASKFDIETGIYLLSIRSAVISDTRFTTINDFKTYLAQQYANGTPVVIEYVMKEEEEIIPYNTDQQAAWIKIRSLLTYNNITNIYSDAYAEIEYVRDNGLDIYETKASAKITKEDVAQLKIEKDRIISEVSSTQSQLNNYYTKNEADNNTNSTKAELENIIQQNKTEIEQTTQAINLRVSSIETNGVDKIETSMGYTFDNDGLNIDKEGAATASTIDNEAFKVKNKTANENVFFAGYVSDQDSAYRGQTIVESTNLVVKNYLNIEGASRFQPYVNPTLGGHGTGAFDIG